MKAADQHMDDFFRKAAAEQKFAYRPDFWKEVESQLNDDSLDTTFKSAAENPRAVARAMYGFGLSIDTYNTP